ncbi:oxidoreductase [Rhizobium sp. BE258]|uniref:oxidoreductase n=1 Tax=Rhizobium sp. BE258 TaxID=2817722 RepID=UPI000DD86555|nr:oxidoreductase [Rhizobium sp. BE258]MDR7144978.1 NAD(P)-dependent dehydrogenase (short-subunit alcohol dehydrogenase family) [Rhizobium sp. BE258]
MRKKHAVALVTGASSGIGQATARALADQGYVVFGTTRGNPVGETDGITMITCDVTSEDSVRDAVGFVIDTAGQVDLLVNNAGIGMLGALEDSSVRQHQALFDVNVFGAIRMIKAVLPAMRARESGRIINISSVLGFIPAPFSASYAASKHALEAYSQSLDHEVRGNGIRVLLIEPAYTKTAFDTNIVRPDEPKPEYAGPRAGADKLIEEALVKGDAPETIARVVLKAASARSPQLRYPAGKIARQLNLARKIIPESILDGMLRKQMKLDQTVAQ